MTHLNGFFRGRNHDILFAHLPVVIGCSAAITAKSQNVHAIAQYEAAA
jgi:hypothetical protein